MEYKEFKYSIKVWLTTVIVAPVIMIIGDYAEHSGIPPPLYHDNFDLLSAYSEIVVLGGICSLPTYVFFYLFIKITVNSANSIARMKGIISILGIALAAGTFELFFFFVGGRTPNMFIYLMIGNCLCIGWFSLFYRLSADEN